MTITVEQSGQTCGALIRGVDLRRPIDEVLAGELRGAWLEHQVVAFPDQQLTIEDLERIALAFGPYGEDPYIRPIAGHPHVIEVKRGADEQAPLFAEAWHSDWSFLPSPPAGTLLYGVEIPPVGGDTLYANQYAAYDALDDDLKVEIDGLVGVHSARYGYSKGGQYGDKDVGRSMSIVSSDDALATQRHPLVRRHPETGRPALFCSMGYTIAIEGTTEDRAKELHHQLILHSVRDEFVYRHGWQTGMLTLWDNRCVQHRATGGYEGHRRLLHRITIAEKAGA